MSDLITAIGKIASMNIKWGEIRFVVQNGKVTAIHATENFRMEVDQKKGYEAITKITTM